MELENYQHHTINDRRVHANFALHFTRLNELVAQGVEREVRLLMKRNPDWCQGEIVAPALPMSSTPADQDGYTVRLMAGTTTLDEYNGGNCASKSTPWVPAAEPWALSMDRLTVIAREVAADIAFGYGLRSDDVHGDATLLAICPNRSSGGDYQPLHPVGSGTPGWAVQPPGSARMRKSRMDPIDSGVPNRSKRRLQVRHHEGKRRSRCVKC